MQYKVSKSAESQMVSMYNIHPSPELHTLETQIFITCTEILSHTFQYNYAVHTWHTYLHVEHHGEIRCVYQK